MKQYKLLTDINSPKDIKKLSMDDLNDLSEEISSYIHDVITNIGGHYSSPLGVVDLTLALHYVYDMPIDKIIWDVGHQAYAHKIVTGRKEDFKRIRKSDSISGFLRRDESKYDIFGAGHASTSISAALGFAHVRDNLNKNNQVVAVIGDGALTGGMAYEGLNNLGYHRTQLTVILNDNSFSISKSVGALSKYLTRITTNPTYNKLRNEIWNISNKVPVISKQVQKILRKTEGTVKSYLTPGILFEELGLRYIGPIDGHDIENMIKVFKSVQNMNTPVLLHVYTDKSKGYLKNNHDAVKSYSVSPKNNSTKNKNYDSYSNILGNALYKLANEHNFICVTAAMGIGTGLSNYAESFKDRYIDVGIAEEHAITYAAGVSAAGILPIVTIYSTFMQRGYDQIIHDIALQKLPAIFCMDRAGIVGEDGPTHHGIFDISFMRSIPNIIVAAPKNGSEFFDLIYTGIKNRHLLSIRYPKKETFIKDNHISKEIVIGTWEILKKGSGVCILATGSMVEESMKAVEESINNLGFIPTLINCRFIKPIDEIMLKKLIQDYNNFITVEEGVISGGFGSSILEYFSCNSIKKDIKLMGISDQFTEHGNRSELLKKIQIDYMSIFKQIKCMYNEK